ncbi:patatin-like phospholipase family protein [Salinirubellus sp. GCM10025818]|uniref:patatin-like phospholipase family protein n=1 Tax=Salinirubellus TaxID=2162630 RepID=UPI0030D32317
MADGPLGDGADGARDGGGRDDHDDRGDGGDRGDGDRPTRVAIACQGGGSHTAFTAGVLRGLLSAWPEGHELVGISGTSGGAFNALAVWYGLVTADETKAVDLLDSLWADLAADTPSERVANDWLVAATRWYNAGFPSASLSPYRNPFSRMGQERIAEVLESRIDFEAIPDLCGRGAPKLVVGTVDVNGGVFETFVDGEVTTDAVLASAAVPELFPAVELHGHAHWDGLFSQNPPVMDLMTVDADRKPDELWVIQINPQVREETPTSLVDIADRRNELSGNISLNQELRFIKWINQWIEAGHLPTESFSRTAVRRIALGSGYGHSTKLDRDPEFIGELMAIGEERAAEFLAVLADPEREPEGIDPLATGHVETVTDGTGESPDAGEDRR